MNICFHANNILFYSNQIGVPPLDLDAMLNDEIFVDKCESNGGNWNEQYSDCEEIWERCTAVGGIRITRNVTPECNEDICLDMSLERISCVFPYEN